MMGVVFVFLLVFVGAYSKPAGTCVPRSVHVSMFNDVGGKVRPVVAWITDGALCSSDVLFGTSETSLNFSSTNDDVATRYDKDAGYNHFVVFNDTLTKDVAVLFYKVGSRNSNVFSKTFVLKNPAFVKNSLKAWVCGDFGVVNAEGTTRAINQFAADLDVAIHPGDISYANDHPLHYESVWTEWFSNVENATSLIPYMAAPGNHEVMCRCLEIGDTKDFEVFKRKFRFPGHNDTNSGRGSGDNMWFSFDLGPVHFLSFSTETDYPGAPHDVKKRRSSPTAQLDFIKADLASVNRSITPFVIVFAHRPIYVNSPGDVNLTNGEPTNQAKNIQDAFEEIFHSFNVDLFVAGHTHMYQRTFPVYKNKLDPTGLVQVITGAGGSIEGLSKFKRVENFSWLAAQYNATTGFGILDANMTHLTFKYFSTAENYPLIDQFELKSRF